MKKPSMQCLTAHSLTHTNSTSALPPHAVNTDTLHYIYTNFHDIYEESKRLYSQEAAAAAAAAASSSSSSSGAKYVSKYMSKGKSGGASSGAKSKYMSKGKSGGRK